MPLLSCKVVLHYANFACVVKMAMFLQVVRSLAACKPIPSIRDKHLLATVISATTYLDRTSTVIVLLFNGC